MKLMILICSGMTNISNSQYFAEKLIESFAENDIQNVKSEIFYIFDHNNSDLIKKTKEYDNILLIAPIYAGTVPSRILDYMKDFESEYNGDKNKSIYVIDNCGFYKFRSNADIVTYRLWVKKVGLNWGGSFRISTGELMLNIKHMPKNKGPHKDMFRNMDIFAQKIVKNEYVELISYPVKFPRAVFMLLGNIVWYKSRKRGSFIPKYVIDGRSKSD